MDSAKPTVDDVFEFRDALGELFELNDINYTRLAVSSSVKNKKELLLFELEDRARIEQSERGIFWSHFPVGDRWGKNRRTENMHLGKYGENNFSDRVVGLVRDVGYEGDLVLNPALQYPFPRVSFEEEPIVHLSSEESRELALNGRWYGFYERGNEGQFLPLSRSPLQEELEKVCSKIRARPELARKGYFCLENFGN